MTTPTDTFTLAAAGDAIITQRLSPYRNDRFTGLVERIRDADASFVNLEVLLHEFEGYPAARSGGTYMQAPGWVADELSWAGFDLFAAANNHTGDYSHGGIEATLRELRERELSFAGLGTTLRRAREPCYLDTPAGRVALVAACSTIIPGSEAGEQRPDVVGRPGLAPIRLNTVYRVPRDAYETVKRLSESIGLEAVKARRSDLGFPVPGADRDAFALLAVDAAEHIYFEPAEAFGIERRLDEADAEATLAQIRDAERQADWVVASLHAHEGADGFWNDDSIPPFLESFARDCVDAGADAFVGHGPHVLRGVEVYEGAPIFYSLGNFLMQNETVSRLPTELYERFDLPAAEGLPGELFDARVFDADGEGIGFLGDRAYWESVLPVCRFEKGELVAVEFDALDLGFGRPRPQRGRPELAADAVADRIFDRLDELSAPYGTALVRDGDRAAVDL